MKAIVCDKCGKVTLLEDIKPYMYPTGIYHLVNDRGDMQELDLCEDCAAELFAAVRTVKDGDGNG